MSGRLESQPAPVPLWSSQAIETAADLADRYGTLAITAAKTAIRFAEFSRSQADQTLYAEVLKLLEANLHITRM